MILHDAASGTIVQEFLYFVWHLCCSWRHRDSFVVDAFATKVYSWYGGHPSLRNVHICMNRPHKYDVVPICGSGLVTLGEFGVGPLRENVPSIFLLHRTGGYQLVHGPGPKCF